ncbi:hypothetical protein H6770_03790 [Candidatus Peribacteria bacterium]|nr:hypothetical protein [Candidatus Peribacteria bacterium]
MKQFHKLFAGSVAVAYLCSTAPVFALTYDNPIDASRARCTSLAGREKDRCVFINNRVERLRLRQAKDSYERGNTQRERRQLLQQQNYESNETRRIRGFDMNRLRKHDMTRRSARRLINSQDKKVRSACEDVDASERAQCIRDNWKEASRGNTK